MTTVTDPEFFTDADRVKGRVVLITGAANGLGRETAILFGKHGASVVIGDVDMKGAEAVVSEIKSFGSNAIAQKCDVTSWDQQLSLFLLAMRTFNRIDIVVPNAGVAELGSMSATQREAVDGIPTKPNLKTLEVNLISVVYTARLALFFLLEGNSGDLKSIVFMGSMSSLEPIPMAPLYTAAKHGIVGLMGSLYWEHRDKLRVAVVCPWFADTSLVPESVNIFLVGMPLTPISRVGGAVFKAATDRDPETNGALWTLPDDGSVFRLDRSQLHLHEGVYKLLNDRTMTAFKLLSRLEEYRAISRGVYRLIGRKMLLVTVMLVMGRLLWNKTTR